MSAEPSIALIGPGAIGGVMAAALGDAGRAVRLCVRTPFERLERTLGGVSREYAHAIESRPEAARPADWVLLCVKAHQTEGAGAWLERLIGPATRVAVMQNGVDHVERVARWVPAERAIPCVMVLPVKADAPGRVTQPRPGVVQVPNTEGGRALAALFAGQDAIAFEPTEDFVSAVWSKLVLNAVGGAICALAVKPLGAVGAPPARDLALALTEEVMAVGRAEGARFPDGHAERTVDHFAGPIAEHWTSIAADRRDGRAMEWEARNAIVGRIARRHGIPTPLNDALTALLALADAPPRGRLVSQD